MKMKMNEYQVLIFESFDDEIATAFDCEATSIDHAKQQAIEAYPHGTITRVIEGLEE